MNSNTSPELIQELENALKDLCEIEGGDEKMNYDEYNEYGRDNYGIMGNRLGNYGRDEYGARGRDSRGRYRGTSYMDRMYNEYGRYEEGREQYNRGNYNAKEDSMKSLEYMLE